MIAYVGHETQAVIDRKNETGADFSAEAVSGVLSRGAEDRPDK